MKINTRETARAIIDAVVAECGDEVHLGDGYSADELLVEAITAALAQSAKIGSGNQSTPQVSATPRRSEAP